jgi:hypothetical protein
MAQDPPAGSFFDSEDPVATDGEGDAFTFLEFNTQGSEYGDYPEFTELSQGTTPTPSWHDHVLPSSAVPPRSGSSSLPPQPLPVPQQQQQMHVPQQQQLQQQLSRPDFPQPSISDEELLGPNDESLMHMGTGGAVSNLFTDEEGNLPKTIGEVSTRERIY